VQSLQGSARYQAAPTLRKARTVEQPQLVARWECRSQRQIEDAQENHDDGNGGECGRFKRERERESRDAARVGARTGIVIARAEDGESRSAGSTKAAGSAVGFSSGCHSTSSGCRRDTCFRRRHKCCQPKRCAARGRRTPRHAAGGACRASASPRFVGGGRGDDAAGGAGGAGDADDGASPGQLGDHRD